MAMNTPSPEKSLEVNNVRITPAVLQFKDPFEGGTYKKTLTIQNISKTSVHIRIGKPSSYFFEIKSLTRGQYLSPGLKIVKYIKLTYNHLTAHKCLLPIYINKTQCDYQIYVKPTSSDLKIYPECIDFGTLDVGLTSAMRTLQLRNDGTKAARYRIDISKRDPQLMAEPSKGILQPRTSVNIRIRLAAFKKLTLMHEFWIICDTPIRVPLKGTIVTPKFEVLHPNSTDKLSLIEFPTTYFGARSVQTLLIRNYSGSSAMFCVLGEISAQPVNLKAAQENDLSYQHFDVFPKEGHLEPKEARIIYFIFRPQKLQTHEKHQDYYLCPFQICRVSCKELVDSDLGTMLMNGNSSSFVAEESSKPISSLYSEMSDGSDLESIPSRHSQLSYELLSDEESKNMIRVYLHGESEAAQVEVIPDAISLRNLSTNQREVRVLEFKNLSKILPVILRYKKVTYIEVERRTIFLKPSENTQVAVYITPCSMGTVRTKITYDLMYYDDPKINDDYKIIGSVSVPVDFDVINFRKPGYKATKRTSQYEEDETSKASFIVTQCRNDVILAPRPENIRRSERSIIRYRTNSNGFSPHGAPQEDINEMIFSNAFKNAVTNYYMESANRKLQPTSYLLKNEKCRDYDLTNDRRLLCTDMNCSHLNIKREIRLSGHTFMPLTPSELNEISVHPKIIRTGEIAEHHKFHFKIRVKNASSAAVYLFIRADKRSLLFLDGDRRIIKSGSEFDVNLEYITSSAGFYALSIDFIVNQSNVYVVTLLADVAPGVLKLNTHHLIFENDETHKYIDLYNPFNKSMSFYWNFEQACFSVDPVQGTVQPKRIVTCIARYLPYNMGSPSIEIEFSSGNKQNQRVGVIALDFRTDYCFHDHIIVFENIPLNIAIVKKAVLRNSGGTAIGYTIRNNQPVEGISIYPSSGVVKANSEHILLVTAKMKACVTFTCTVCFDIIRYAPIELIIKGNVVYPEINIIPNDLHLQKIPSSSYDLLKFLIENKSLAKATVDFDIDEYHEYRLSKSQHFGSQRLEETITLDANSFVPLYLHFQPSDVSSGTFCLPIIVNNIIGPPLNADIITTKVDYYLKKNIPNTESVLIPTQLPRFKVRRRTTPPKIRFSKSVLEFFYAPWNKRNKTELDLVIHNPQNEAEDLCIRTDDLKYPFSFKFSQRERIEERACSVVCSLDAKEEIVLMILFNPKQPGNFEMVLPVFLRSDPMDRVHTFLHCKGTYPTPSITSLDPQVYFTPIFPQVNLTGHTFLKMVNHKQNCILSSRTSLTGLNISIPSEYYSKNIDGAEFEIKISIMYYPENSGVFSATILFTCTCGANCEVPVVGIVENCFITNHTFVQTYMKKHLREEMTIRRIRSLKSGTELSIDSDASNLNKVDHQEIDTENFFVSYPSFPQDTEDITNYMNTIVMVAETWVHTQCFFCKHFFKIPEGIQVLPVVAEEKHRKKKLWIMPFAQLLINLVGNDMINYLGLSDAPTAEDERVIYCYKVYKKSLYFLEQLGAHMPHVKPEYLLEYSFYIYYMENLNPGFRGTILNCTEFYFTAKQAWLDLILQTYKVLILFRLKVKTVSLHSDYSSMLEANMRNLSFIENAKREYIFCINELVLLEWLEYNYNSMAKKLWGKSTFICNKSVDNFEQNLDDGLVFAALIITHCPYMEAHFNNLYVPPITYEENLHNAIKFTQSMEMLNLSFCVQPDEIVKITALQILMLVSYLFEVLPDLQPTESITFKAGLSTSCTKYFKLKNENDFQIAYQVIFFNNDNESFSTNYNTIVIPPRKFAKLAIKYNAFFLQSIRATLVLSGECAGFHYCKSRTLTLVGEPDFLYMTTVINVPTYLYKLVEISLTFKSPYPMPAMYKLQMTYDEPKDLNDIANLPNTYECIYLSTRRFHPEKDEYFFNESGECKINGTTCALSYIMRSVWIYFRNPNLGDFAIRLNMYVHLTQTYHMLDVVIPKHSSNVFGSTVKQRDMVVYIRIPCQNVMMWNAIKEMIVKVLKGDELEFWKNLMRRKTGIHVLQRLFLENKMSASTDIQYIFKKHVEYNISVHKCTGVSLPTSLVIEDEFASGYQEIPLKLNNTTEIPNNFSFFLQSVDGRKMRPYITNFTYAAE